MPSTRTLPPLLVRADADRSQGAGHVMRSLALAQAWRRRGGAIHYLTHRPAATLRRRLEAAGASVLEIEKRHPVQADLRAARERIDRLRRESETLPWVVLDGYHFAADYQRALRSAGCRLLVIDDHAHLPRYHADLVLNHGVHAPRLEYPDCGKAWLLLGTRYALLRPEFEAWRGFARTVPEKAKKILVTLGGADDGNVTMKVVEAMALLGDAAVEALILAGPLNPHLSELREAASISPRLRLLSDVTDPAPLMAWADIAVSAAGTTAWELAFMQVPALLLVLAENQVSVAEGLEGFGAAQSFGAASGVGAAAIAQALCDLIHDAPRRRRMAERGRILVDGMGPARVLAAMERRTIGFLDSELSVRPATGSDKLLLWEWANDQVARRHSLSSAAISWDEHERWYAEKSASPDCRRWILSAGDLPVGQIRYERDGEETAKLSFSVAAGFRGSGFGTRLLQLTIERAARELGVRRIEGAALVQNQASRKAFLKAGFVAVEERIVSGKHCVIFRRHCGARAQTSDHAACL